jgi:UbiD family decarboxylase
VRSFLQKLEVNNYEKTIESDQLAKIIKENEEKPTIFNINSFKFPIVSGLVNNREKIALALEIDKTKIISFMIEKLHNLKKCNLTKNAPFLENKINLSSDLHIDQFLPVIDFYKGRRYTTSSIVICDFPGSNSSKSQITMLEVVYLLPL